MSTALDNEISSEVAKVVLKAKYPHLTMVEPDTSPLVVAAKNIREWADAKREYKDQQRG